NPQHPVGDPEHAVVEVGEDHGADRRPLCRQHHVDLQAAQDRGGNGGGGDHRHRAASLDQPNQAGDDEGKQDGRQGGGGDPLGGRLAGPAFPQDVSPGSAGAGDEQDDPGGTDSLFHPVQGFRTAEVADQTVNGDQKSQADGDDGGADEHQVIVNAALKFQGADGRVDEDQQDRNHDGGQRTGQGRKVFFLFQFEQFLIGFRPVGPHPSEPRFIGQLINPFSEPFRIVDAGDEDGNPEEQAG